MPLFLILVLVPIIEIALFIQVGGFLGLWPTLAIVVLTALAGTILLRGQGLATMTNLQNAMGKGENPMDHMAHGAMILVAGVVLLTPGFFTDAVGLALLIPGVRNAVIKYGASRVKNNPNVHVFQQGQQHPDPEPDVVDADYEVLDGSEQPGSSGWTKSKNDKT